MHKIYAIVIGSIFFILFSQLSAAETCPSVSDIKHHSIATGWKAHDSDDDSLIPSDKAAHLADHIDQFALAEWSDKGNKTSTIHCYYRDKHGSNSEAYFSKDHYQPDNAKNMWYQVSGSMHCAASMEKCAFNNDVAAPSQLANK